MKRSKLLVLTSLVLTLLMLFSACGKSENMLGKILIDETTYTDSTSAYTVGEKIADLSGATVDSYRGELVLLKKDIADEVGKTKYMVYNISTNSIVWSETQTPTLGLSVTLDYLSPSSDPVSYFVVQATTLNPDDVNAPVEIDTTLYSATAEKLATVDGVADVVEIEDLIYFDGKCYRASKEGSIAYAFDYSTLAKLPGNVAKYNDVYYEWDGEAVTTYDKDFQFIAKYRLPIHVEDDGELLGMVVLENGNLFLQYAYEADPYTDEYTYIAEGVKYILVTQIVDTEKGTSKEIKCEYVVEGAINMLQWDGEEVKGIDTKTVPVYGGAYLIENKRLSAYRCVIINNKGKITEIGEINGDQIESFSLFADNCWIVSTEGGEYLVDADGKVIGDVTEAETFGKFLYKDGKIYDAALNVIYDYRTNKQTIKSVVGDSLLLEDEEDRLLLYTGSGDPVVLIDKDSEKTLVGVPGPLDYYRFVLLKDGEKLEVYNELGVLVGTVNDVNSGRINMVTSTDDAIFLTMYTPAGETVYYRLG